MSVVVAIKDKDRIWIGCDSQMTRENRTKEAMRGGYKIWKPTDDDQVVMGGAGRVRDINIISTATGWVDEPCRLKGSTDMKYMIRTVVPKIFMELESFGSLEIKDGIKSMCSAFLFGYKNQIYEILSEGAVLNSEEMAVIGSGYVECLGAWDVVKNCNMIAKDKLLYILRAGCKTSLYVNYPIIIMNTLDNETEVISKEDFDRQFCLET